MLIDALNQITGTTEKYSSPIAEPFTFIPHDQRSIALPDGSITSAFLENFGRPARDTGLESERNNRITASQRLTLLKSTQVQRKLEQGPKLQALIRNRTAPREVIDGLYLTVLSRPPPPEERRIVTARALTGPDGRTTAIDLAWALINSAKFLYRHRALPRSPQLPPPPPMNLHHSVDPRFWNLASALRLLGLGSPPMTRREAIRRGLVGTAGLALSGGLVGRALAAPAAPKAKSVIQIWLWSGPCHLDTFDPKPAAGYDYYGDLKTPIPTNVAGIQIGELLPLLAQQADKYSAIRSMNHGINGHERAADTVQTGRASGGRDVFPGTGAVVSLFKGYDAGYTGLLPPCIVVTELRGRVSDAGFLGGRYKPFATGGDPGAARFVVEGVVARGIADERQRARREFLHQLNTFERAMPGGDPRLAALGQCEHDAYAMILGDAGKVFDLSQENDALRDGYGRNTFGQSCRMARRLVERGVPYITINYKGWDTHKQHLPIMRRKLPAFDRGRATLLADLAERDLLDSTIVLAGGGMWPHTEGAVGIPLERRARPLGKGLLGLRRRRRLQGRPRRRPDRRARRGRHLPAGAAGRSDREPV